MKGFMRESTTLKLNFTLFLLTEEERFCYGRYLFCFCFCLFYCQILVSGLFCLSEYMVLIQTEMGLSSNIATEEQNKSGQVITTRFTHFLLLKDW